MFSGYRILINSVVVFVVDNVVRINKLRVFSSANRLTKCGIGVRVRSVRKMTRNVLLWFSYWNLGMARFVTFFFSRLTFFVVVLRLIVRVKMRLEWNSLISLNDNSFDDWGSLWRTQMPVLFKEDLDDRFLLKYESRESERENEKRKLHSMFDFLFRLFVHPMVRSSVFIRYIDCWVAK